MEDVDIKQKAQDIAEVLQEEARGPLVTIERLLRHIGLDFVEATLKETQDIQARGGMLIKDGSRQRSMGGVFMYLAKSKLDPEDRNRIFPNSHQRKKKKKVSQTLNAESDQMQELKVAAKTLKQKMPPVESEELKKLKTAATTLRQRFSAMEASGQKGIKMTQKLLAITERKIALLQQMQDDV